MPSQGAAWKAAFSHADADPLPEEMCKAPPHLLGNQKVFTKNAKCCINNTKHKDKDVLGLTVDWSMY